LINYTKYYTFAFFVCNLLIYKGLLEAWLSANPPATALPTNEPPTPVPTEAVRVYPRAWQREWLQRYLAAQMAQSAQTIKPTADDIAIASMRHGQAQRAADADYQRRTGKAAVARRWVKRD
jgi:hypothetical protein